MRKPRVLKPKIWNSTAPLHFWESERTNGTKENTEGEGLDIEQVAHGRVYPGALRSFDSRMPTFYGASPYEYRSLAIQKSHGKKWW